MNKNNKEYYMYLEDLRQSGVTNMFGAAPYLQQEFDIPIKEARAILTEWMQNYEEISKAFY